MCDTLCALGATRTLFAKNSDRPPTEVQLVAPHARRGGGGTIRTQYLEIDDVGAYATLLARPSWLWGAEHGVNEYGVAIGNEKVYTTLDAQSAPAALIGMDLVRLGLERATNADEALEVITGLLARHGQGGVADTYGEAYFSSFLIADPTAAWVLETSGASWVARPVEGNAAISNRLAIRDDWTQSSPDVAPGADFDTWRDPAAPTGIADSRLQASCAVLGTSSAEELGARDLAAHLRDHGSGPWGAPGSGDAPVPPPTELLVDWTGMSVCMHLHDYMNTTSAMICELPQAGGGPLRTWVAPGNPCVSIFVPTFPRQRDGEAIPEVLADESVWGQVATLRQEVEKDPQRLGVVRAELDPLEAQLWSMADEAVGAPSSWPELAVEVDAAVRAVLGRLVP
jgi:dipeptidase